MSSEGQVCGTAPLPGGLSNSSVLAMCTSGGTMLTVSHVLSCLPSQPLTHSDLQVTSQATEALCSAPVYILTGKLYLSLYTLRRPKIPTDCATRQQSVSYDEGQDYFPSSYHQ